MTTTAQELIDRLNTFPPDLVVITSADDEGNSYRYVDLDWVNVEGYSDVDGEIETGLTELTSQLEEQGWSEEDVKPNSCIVIG